MKKPDMRLTLLQVTPPLPDPYEFSEAILESIKFIDDNPNATIQDMTDKMLELWSVAEEEIRIIHDHFGKLEELYLSPTVVSSLIIFSHIYIRFYRLEDFGDMDNFIRIYSKFQTLLNSIKMTNDCPEYCYHMIAFNIFKLDRLDENLDLLRARHGG